MRRSHATHAPCHIQDTESAACNVLISHAELTPILVISRAAPPQAAVNTSRDGALIVADDCSLLPRHNVGGQGVMAGWRAMVERGHIFDHFQRDVPSPSGVKGWCVGHVVRRRGDSAQLSRGFSRLS